MKMQVRASIKKAEQLVGMLNPIYLMGDKSDAK